MWLFGKKNSKEKETKTAQPQTTQKEKTTQTKVVEESKIAKKKNSESTKPSNPVDDKGKKIAAEKVPQKNVNAEKNSKTTTKTGTASSTNTKKVETTTKTEKKQENQSTENKKPAKKAVYRVLFDKNARLWLIKKDGAKRTIASFQTKDEALARVKELSSSNDLNFVVHKKDGKFQKK